MDSSEKYFNSARKTDMSTGTRLPWSTQTAEPEVYTQASHDTLHRQEQDTLASRTQGQEKNIVIVAIALFLFVIVKNAWLSDDSYITLRTVYNFTHGYGLTWNTDERVQSFTHPLWMFLLSGSYLIIHSLYFSTLFVALVISLVAVIILALRLAPAPHVALIGLALLAASKSFADYSTSGLENPLTHLLIVLFAVIFFQYRQRSFSLLWLSLLSCLMILNRMDTILILLPALTYAWFQAPQGRVQGLRTITIAFMPFVIWELFSLLYYGFLFPNTAYAKIGTGITDTELIKQGIAYMAGSFQFDPLLFIVLLISTLFVIFNKDWKSLPFIAGMLLYLLYTIKVGGDFMAGRFLTPPFLLATILLLRNLSLSTKNSWLLPLAFILLIGFAVPNSRWYILPALATTTNSNPIDSRGVADEHLYYAGATGLINYQRDSIWPASSWTQAGLQAHTIQQRVTLYYTIGFYGVMAGPHVHIVDGFALADPLLARLPMQKNAPWRIGHFQRCIPRGYMQSIATGINLIADPAIALYYDKLHLVVSGPILSPARLLEIWRLNTGVYTPLLQKPDCQGQTYLPTN